MQSQRFQYTLGISATLKVVCPLLSHQLHVGTTKFQQIEKSVSVDIFSQIFFQTNSTRAETHENQVNVVFGLLPDLPGGIYRRWNLGILPNNGEIPVLGPIGQGLLTGPRLPGSICTPRGGQRTTLSRFSDVSARVELV